jgi:predicted Zn-dependent protease
MRNWRGGRDLLQVAGRRNLRYRSVVDNAREDRMRFTKHFERAQGWLLLDRPDLAAGALAEIPPAFRTAPEVLRFRAELHMAAQEWTLAEPVLRQLLEADVDDPQHWVSLAFAVRRAKSIGEAEGILREARERFPKVSIIWFNLACYAAQQDRPAVAHRLLGEALRLEPALRQTAQADSDLAPYWKALAAGEISPAT